MVVVVLEEAGRPSAAVEGKGSVSRKVGKADVSVISFAEGVWVVLPDAMAYNVQLRREGGRGLRRVMQWFIARSR